METVYLQNMQHPQAVAAQDAVAAAQAQLELGPNHHNQMALRRPFDPVAHDLDSTFRLTRFADLKG